MSTVVKWSCEGCGQAAVKHRDLGARAHDSGRWVIEHHKRCPDHPDEREDVGPVTSVNDPNNALFRRDSGR